MVRILNFNIKAVILALFFALSGITVSANPLSNDSPAKRVRLSQIEEAETKPSPLNENTAAYSLQFLSESELNAFGLSGKWALNQVRREKLRRFTERNPPDEYLSSYPALPMGPSELAQFLRENQHYRRLAFQRLLLAEKCGYSRPYINESQARWCLDATRTFFFAHDLVSKIRESDAKFHLEIITSLLQVAKSVELGPVVRESLTRILDEPTILAFAQQLVLSTDLNQEDLEDLTSKQNGEQVNAIKWAIRNQLVDLRPFTEQHFDRLLGMIQAGEEEDAEEFSRDSTGVRSLVIDLLVSAKPSDPRVLEALKNILRHAYHPKYGRGTGLAGSANANHTKLAYTLPIAAAKGIGIIAPRDPETLDILIRVDKHASDVKKWRRALKPATRSIVENFAGREAIKLGYDDLESNWDETPEDSDGEVSASAEPLSIAPPTKRVKLNTTNETDEQTPPLSGVRPAWMTSFLEYDPLLARAIPMAPGLPMVPSELAQFLRKNPSWRKVVFQKLLSFTKSRNTDVYGRFDQWSLDAARTFLLAHDLISDIRESDADFYFEIVTGLVSEAKRIVTDITGFRLLERPKTGPLSEEVLTQILDEPTVLAFAQQVIFSENAKHESEMVSAIEWAIGHHLKNCLQPFAKQNFDHLLWSLQASDEENPEIDNSDPTGIFSLMVKLLVSAKPSDPQVLKLLKNILRCTGFPPGPITWSPEYIELHFRLPTAAVEGIRMIAPRDSETLDILIDVEKRLKTYISDWSWTYYRECWRYFSDLRREVKRAARVIIEEFGVRRESVKLGYYDKYKGSFDGSSESGLDSDD